MRTENVLDFISKNSETNLQSPSTDLMLNTGRETQNGELIFDVPFNLIMTNPDALQPRETPRRHDAKYYARKQHVAQLRKPLLNPKKDLEPIIIMWAVGTTLLTNTGYNWVVVDGHHRLEAYKSIEGRKTVPAIIFKGSPRDAVLHAISANNHDKLAMNAGEKLSTAWSVFVAMSGVKGQSATILELGVSRGSLQKFRNQFNLITADISSGKLDDKLIGQFDWTEARDYPNTRNSNIWSDDDNEIYIEMVTDKLFKTFGHTLKNGSVENLSAALERYLGQTFFQAILDYYKDTLADYDFTDLHEPESDF